MEPLTSLSYIPEYLWSFYTEALIPKPKWSPDQIPDLSEKVFIITGANSGIGKGVAEDLLAHNGKVYIAGRSVERVTAAIEDLKKATGKADDRVKFLRLDLEDLKSVKSAVDEFLSKESKLDVLINNAAVVRVPGMRLDQITAAGLNLEFAVNVLGHFYLTQLLLPILISTARSSPDGKVRVVNLSSVGHFGSKIGKNGPIDYKSLEGRQCFPYLAYSQSKSGNILFSNELARRYEDQGIVSITVHPGAVDTAALRKLPPLLSNLLYTIGRFTILYPVSYGKIGTSYAATAPEAIELGGKYLIPWDRVGSPRSDHLDPEKQQKLWTWLEEKVKELA